MIMKLCHRLYKFSSGRILLTGLAILFTVCVGSANSASEPGTVTIVLQLEPQNIDPCDALSNLTGQVIMRNIVEPLVERNPEEGKINSRLATSWKQVDQNTWQFFLRKGVKFHDGKEFNAEAVVFNMKRIYDKRIVSQVRGKFLDNVKMEGKALDHYTLEVKTEKFEPLMLTLMGFLTICSPDTPMDKWTRNPIGTGPFKFVKWDAGQQITLERFDGYWGKQPQVKKAVYKWRPESSVRAAMVEIGEADLTPNIAKQDANRSDLDYSYLNTETTFIRFGGVWEPPLNDRRVRLALNYAIDREALRGSILSKDVIPASQIILPSILGYNPDLKPVPYDPQKAKQLLDEARRDGVPVDKEITLVGRIEHYPGISEVLEAMMTMYKAVGLNVKLKMAEVAVWQANYRQKPYPTNIGPYIISMSHGNDAGDAAFTFFYSYHCKGIVSPICDKQVDELIEKAQIAMGEERRRLWQAAFKRVHTEIIPDAMLFHMVAYCRVGKRINFKPSIVTNIEIPLAQITFKE
jgi:peptide/nickel transport system substrate-binding protein